MSVKTKRPAKDLNNSVPSTPNKPSAVKQVKIDDKDSVTMELDFYCSRKKGRFEDAL